MLFKLQFAHIKNAISNIFHTLFLSIFKKQLGIKWQKIVFSLKSVLILLDKNHCMALLECLMLLQFPHINNKSRQELSYFFQPFFKLAFLFFENFLNTVDYLRLKLWSQLTFFFLIFLTILMVNEKKTHFSKKFNWGILF